MADVAILAALKALKDVLVDEVLKLMSSQTSELLSMFSELDSRMENIRIELRVMQAFLDEINTHIRKDKTLEVWLEEVRNLAYHIQDIVDEFMYLSHNRENGGIRSYVKRFFREPSLGPFRRIGSQLQEAEKSLTNLSETKDRWVSSTRAEMYCNPHYYNECSQQSAISTHFIDEDELVGVEENRALLMSWLNSMELNLSIVSVWGMGGLGKTTLVTNVFKREKGNFDCYAWISISQTYVVDHILRKLIYEICRSEKGIPINTTSMDHRELKETLRELLKEKKYVIVLDDVWDPRAFRDIHDVFIDSQKGSRIFITSRNAEVAFLAPESQRLELMPLGESESWKLFCQKAFVLERSHACPHQLDRWAREIAIKCEGLPLALASIGGMLSLHEKSIVEWKRVHDQLSWEFEHNPSFDHLRNILNLSFNYLPRYLKNCFLYCCMFPEDHLLKRKKLIRLWMAEGFVEERGASTLEEIAEGYLIELVSRSMLQIVNRNGSGRVRRLRMHDTLRELAMSLCIKENFGLLDEDNRIVKVHTKFRRLSINKLSNEIKNSEYLPLRTFMSFGSDVVSSSMISSILLNSRYLTVLDLEGLNMEVLPDTIGDLFNLRYLGLRNTMVKFLPKSVEKLRNLLTLDLYASKIQRLPDGMAELKKLRHLFAEVMHDKAGSSFRSATGIHLPKGMYDLKELQTLQALEADSEVVKKLGNLTQLRSIRIWNVEEKYSADLCTALSKLTLLSFLNISSSNENEFIHLEGLNPQYTDLYHVYLNGRLKQSAFESPLFQISGENFQTLTLRWSQLWDDPLPSLSHLSNLRILYLSRTYLGPRLVFRVGWFPKLHGLCLFKMSSLIQVEMEEGTLAALDYMDLRDMKQLMEIPKGIEHITTLQYMFCKGLSPDFGDGLVTGLNYIHQFKCYVQP
ncbi:hypothetical protein LUZ60_005216 [Juncus effusus]|nr:hypothetical protein LUZ60_005216 [Juncus effusus]